MMEFETVLDGKWCLHKDTEGQLPTSRAKQATHVYRASISHRDVITVAVFKSIFFRLGSKLPRLPKNYSCASTVILA